METKWYSGAVLANTLQNKVLKTSQQNYCKSPVWILTVFNKYFYLYFSCYAQNSTVILWIQLHLLQGFSVHICLPLWKSNTIKQSSEPQPKTFSRSTTWNVAEKPLFIILCILAFRIQTSPLWVSVLFKFPTTFYPVTKTPGYYVILGHERLLWCPFI
jgi:hypothetical protein